MITAIDLFAGLGGWSTGARMAGVEVLWAANHWPVAVEWHSANHPGAIHVCQKAVRITDRKTPSDIMYRGHLSLEGIAEMYAAKGRDELAATMKGAKRFDSGSCSESCEVFSCAIGEAE